MERRGNDTGSDLRIDHRSDVGSVVVPDIHYTSYFHVYIDDIIPRVWHF